MLCLVRTLQLPIFIVSTVSISLFVVLVVMVICCIRRKSKRQNSAIRRRLPPYTNQKVIKCNKIYSYQQHNNIIFLNIYLQQDIVKGKTNGLELSSLIPGSSASSQKSDKYCKVRQYALGEITFLQEIGEGAFGMYFYQKCIFLMNYIKIYIYKIFEQAKFSKVKCLTIWVP